MLKTPSLPPPSKDSTYADANCDEQNPRPNHFY